MLSNFAGRLYVDGHKVEIPAGSSSTTITVSYPYDTKLVGIQAFADDTKYGDYIDLTINHPVAGEVGRFGNNCYLPEAGTKGRIATSIFLPGDYQGAEVAQGLQYKIHYTAIDTAGRKLIVWLMLRR